MIISLTVCSDKLILISSCPDALAIAVTKLVLPTPGDPSSKIGLGSCRPRNTRTAFWDVVGAFSAYLVSRFSGMRHGPENDENQYNIHQQADC